MGMFDNFVSTLYDSHREFSKTYVYHSEGG